MTFRLCLLKRKKIKKKERKENTSCALHTRDVYASLPSLHRSRRRHHGSGRGTSARKERGADEGERG